MRGTMRISSKDPTRGRSMDIGIFREKIMELEERLEMSTICTGKEKRKRQTQQWSLQSSHLGMLHE